MIEKSTLKLSTREEGSLDLQPCASPHGFFLKQPMLFPSYPLTTAQSPAGQRRLTSRIISEYTESEREDFVFVTFDRL